MQYVTGLKFTRNCASESLPTMIKTNDDKVKLEMLSLETRFFYQQNVYSSSIGILILNNEGVAICSILQPINVLTSYG